MNSKEKLFSSALNGITAYEDKNEKRIRSEDILKINNGDLRRSIKRVHATVTSKIGKIEEFVNSIPPAFNGIEVMSDIRKKYYLETFKLRLENILNTK